MICPKCNEYYPDVNSHCSNCGLENPLYSNSQPKTNNYASQNDYAAQNSTPQPNQTNNGDFSQHYQYRSDFPQNQANYNAYQNQYQEPIEVDNSNAYVKYWKNAFNFSGRTRRRDFFIPYIINLAIAIVLSMVIMIPVMTGLIQEHSNSPKDYEDYYYDYDVSYDYETDFDDGFYYSYETDDIDDFLEVSSRFFNPISIIGIILLVVFGFLDFIPGISSTVRRLHDTGKSGLCFFLCFIPYIGSLILLIFLFLDSDVGANKYGPNPKGNNGFAPSNTGFPMNHTSSFNNQNFNNTNNYNNNYNQNNNDVNGHNF